MEVVCQTDDKNTTNNLSTMETFSSNTAGSGLEAELSNLNSIHISYQPLIQAATWLLQKEPSFDGIPASSKHMRSLLSLLVDVLG